MSDMTVFLARGFGLFGLILCPILAVRPKAAIGALNAIVDDPGTRLTLAVFILAGGVACVLGHSVWTGGPLPVVVTLLGWATLGKGAALLAIPPAGLKGLYRALHYPQTFRLFMLAGAIFGGGLIAAAAAAR